MGEDEDAIDTLLEAAEDSTAPPAPGDPSDTGITDVGTDTPE